MLRGEVGSSTTVIMPISGQVAGLPEQAVIKATDAMIAKIIDDLALMIINAPLLLYSRIGRIG